MKVIRFYIVVSWDVKVSLESIKVSFELPLQTSVFLKLGVLRTTIIRFSVPAHK